MYDYGGVNLSLEIKSLVRGDSSDSSGLDTNTSTPCWTTDTVNLVVSRLL